MRGIAGFLLFITIGCRFGYAQNNETTASRREKVVFDSTYTMKIHSSLPVSRFRLIEKKDSTRYYYTIQYQQDARAPVTQVIRGTPAMVIPVDQKIEFTDVNFDGYKDIKMCNYAGGDGIDLGYAIYLFRKATHTYVYSKKFSDLFIGADFTLHPEKKEITSFYGLGCFHRCWEEDTYKVDGAKLTLVGRTTQEQDDENPDIYYQIKEKLIKDTLRVVSKKKVDL